MPLKQKVMVTTVLVQKVRTSLHRSCSGDDLPPIFVNFMTRIKTDSGVLKNHYSATIIKAAFQL
jgi:hypothetical protein